ncbi:peroxiredoxin [Cardinium endosymbiont of Culicoides punctatus]|uniref:peroxiredoxin n=1 Tax=Cardinium endosymbiont of Culicoides punctatus TaxID=2304601 RepID=UPI001058C560|nr:peroxiredoxin [Cardinium endosymbiont of Culicoides punctatus]TDG95613.1 putative peroxiredoxin [Cardinium endosymbiont of Culicoides punctatus]
MSLLGTKAPIFKASAVIKGGTVVDDFSLEQFLGKKEVILFFYPKDFTFVCPTELLSFQQELFQFEQRNVALVGCSTDTEETHVAWLNTDRTKGGIAGITYPLIADVSKTISANYGVLGGSWDYNESGQLVFSGIPVAYRGTFLIDKEGIIRYVAINDLPLGRNVDEILRIVDMWQHVVQFGEVCPANWIKGDVAMHATQEGISDYLTNHFNK